MALPETKIDMSGEDWDTPVEFFEGAWVIANRHAPGLNTTMELNNRTFVFRLHGKTNGQTLLVFGCASQPAVDAVKRLERQTGLKVSFIVGNGGGHHLFLDLWYQAFPQGRILVPAKRIPFTRNGKNLQAKYAKRWELLHGPKPAELLEEFGDEIDIVVFDQLMQYKDENHGAAFNGGSLDHASTPTSFGGFAMLKAFGKIMGDVSQPTDEVVLFHKKSGLVIAGHNFPFSYVPKGYKAPVRFALKAGPFPINLMMKMTMMKPGSFKSLLETQPGPIADPKRHAEAWEAVLAWPIRAWVTAHDPPTVSGPDMAGEEIKNAVRESIHRSGEDDPSGARLKWNIKHARG